MNDAAVSTDMLNVQVDGQAITVLPGTTIRDAALRVGIHIPVLCHSDRMDPVGVCRMCVVDVGERVLAASCIRQCTDGMTVETASPNVEKHRAMLTRLLLSDHPVPCQQERTTADCRLEALGRRYGLIDGAGPNRFPSGNGRPADISSPVIAVDHQACILCDLCVRACDDLQSNHVISRSGKGYDARIGFDLDDPMGESTCVSCGECVSACPTGALTDKPVTLPLIPREELTSVESVCPYCGVGCAVTVHVKDNRVVFAEGRESPVNHQRLCVKGRYGWDYTSHPQRLTKPLIRRDEFYPKGPLSTAVRDSLGEVGHKPGGVVDYGEVLPAFREAEWDEALELAGRRLRETRDSFGSDAMAGFGSAKCSNEEAYLFQKLIRAGFGTNNVDHCTRLCHASSVAALLQTIGSGAVTNVFADVARAGVVLVTGTNAAANHPVAATFMKQATKIGTKLIMVDVRRQPLADFATHFAQIRPGTDVAFYNAVMHALIRDGRIDREFIERRTDGFDELSELVLASYSPAQAAPICGVPASLIDEIAATIGETVGSDRGLLIFWGMGIAQHTNGTNNARCLISLCLLTGNVGRPGTGLHPLRGQNNVQGASDAGLIPMVYPDYQPVAESANREKFERAWGHSLDPNPGLTVVEIMDGALAGTIRAMYIMGENPFISDPNSNKVRKALANLDFLAVQDIFLTETAEFADVILPAASYFEKDGTYTNTDRRVQLGRTALQPPGEARQDWKIVCEIAARLGLDMKYASTSDVFDEFTALTSNYAGLTHANLGPTGKLWPCPDPVTGDGVDILFGDEFPTPNGRGRLVPCDYQPADEPPDDEYPFVLSTGRVLEHWHTGSMTRRSAALNAIQPTAFACVNAEDLRRLGLSSGSRIRVTSRRGTIQLEARADDSIDSSCVFIPFHFREAAANVLTTDALDPDGKIPEFKYCAVRIERAQ